MSAGSAIDIAAPVKLTSSPALTEAAEALMVLGYDKPTVTKALSGIDASVSDVGEIIKLALKKLAR